VVLARLAELGSATVYEANGQSGALDASLKPLDPTRTLAGRAVTVDLPPADNWYSTSRCSKPARATSWSSTPRATWKPAPGVTLVRRFRCY
jgi:regulator of RNase E activity RraA